jgi:hypothetical protein
MNDSTRIDHETRQRILMLLSDNDVARVSTAEATARPLDGEEYIDLEELDRGVRSALGTTAPMNRLVLRRSVNEATWNKIREELTLLSGARPRETPMKGI